MKVLTVFGTRPEAIKMCPLVLELNKHKNIKSLVCTTGQHKEMLKQVLQIFNIEPDYHLDIMTDSQTLGDITSRVLSGVEQVIKDCKPDIVLVHGDTTTSFAAALAAFYQKTAVGHVEAGLRTYNKYSPFPEEINRNLVSKLADFHFAPTQINKIALQKEGIVENVFVTGNTVIDAFAATVKENYKFKEDTLNTIDYTKKIIVLTAHRRENWGKGIDNICDALQELVQNNKDVLVVYPVHLNPLVRKQVFEKLSNKEQVFLIDPIDVQDMHNLIAKSYCVLTDSGGLQEEAPHLHKPVIVLRTETERPEAVAAGTAIVAGVEKENIVAISQKVLNDKVFYSKMQNSKNPYGDGTASQQITKILIDHCKSYNDNII